MNSLQAWFITFKCLDRIRRLYSCVWPANVSGRPEHNCNSEKGETSFPKRLCHTCRHVAAPSDTQEVVGSWFGRNSVDLPTGHSTGGSRYCSILQKIVPCLSPTLQDIKIGRKLILTEINCKHQGGLPLGDRIQILPWSICPGWENNSKSHRWLSKVLEVRRVAWPESVIVVPFSPNHSVCSPMWLNVNLTLHILPKPCFLHRIFSGFFIP